MLTPTLTHVDTQIDALPLRRSFLTWLQASQYRPPTGCLQHCGRQGGKGNISTSESASAFLQSTDAATLRLFNEEDLSAQEHLARLFQFPHGCIGIYAKCVGRHTHALTRTCTRSPTQALTPPCTRGAMQRLWIVPDFSRTLSTDGPQGADVTPSVCVCVCVCVCVSVCSVWERGCATEVPPRECIGAFCSAEAHCMAMLYSVQG